MKKSMVGPAGLALLAVLLLTIAMIIQEIPHINFIIGIKRKIDMVVNLNDEGSGVNAFLNTHTPAVSVPDSVALHAAGYERDNSELQYIMKKVEIPGLGIYMPPSADGKPQEKLYGVTMALSGYTVEIPLPGGGRGRMEVFLDAP